MFTIGNWLFFGFYLSVVLGFSVYLVGEWDSILAAIINFVVAITIGIAIMCGIAWYHTNTASGIRSMKDYQSELSNGIEREIRITAEDGREIFYYEGKVDIESNHEDSYIKFESEDGKRYIVYYGVQDTITIIEK